MNEMLPSYKKCSWIWQ